MLVVVVEAIKQLQVQVEMLEVMVDQEEEVIEMGLFVLVELEQQIKVLLEAQVMAHKLQVVVEVPLKLEIPTMVVLEAMDYLLQ